MKKHESSRILELNLLIVGKLCPLTLNISSIEFHLIQLCRQIRRLAAVIDLYLRAGEMVAKNCYRYVIHRGGVSFPIFLCPLKKFGMAHMTG